MNRRNLLKSMLAAPLALLPFRPKKSMRPVGWIWAGNGFTRLKNIGPHCVIPARSLEPGQTITFITAGSYGTDHEVTQAYRWSQS